MNNANSPSPLLFVVLTIVCCCYCCSATAFAQSSSGSISGRVVDAGNAVIAGARVTITNPQTGISTSVTSDDDGVFVAPQLPPATYTIAVEQQGFKRVEKTDVVLSTAGRLDAGEFVLEVGEVADTVTVRADAGELQLKSDSGERSELITNTQIRDIAINARTPLDLLRVVPGAINPSASGISGPAGIAATNINGTRANQLEITIDGASNKTPASGVIQFVSINPDALQEVKIQTSNYAAEFGKAGGAQVQYTTRSGTNRFRGSARYFRRHDSLNANTYFNNAQGRFAADALLVTTGQRNAGDLIAPRQLFRFNYYGYDIGGPVILPRFGEGGAKLFNGKDKLFFFFNQEYYRQLIPSNAVNLRVPTPAERNGDFSQTTDGNGNRVFLRDPTKSGDCTAANTAANPGACFVYQGRLNVIDPARFYADGQAILNLYDLPNNPAGGLQFNNSTQLSRLYPRREDILRIDYNISDATRLTFRYINNPDREVRPYGGINGLDFNVPISVAVGPRAAYNAVVNLFHAFSPTLTNELIIAPSHFKSAASFGDDGATRARRNINLPLLFPNAPGAEIIPNFAYGGIANNAFPTTQFTAVPRTTFNDNFNVIDNVTKVAGKHTIKTGIFIERARYYFPPNVATTGAIDFSNDANNPFNTRHPYANALLGIYTSYQQADKLPDSAYKYLTIEGYVQDTWRVHPRLTLDVGLRVSHIPPAYNETLSTSTFNPELFNPARAVSLYRPVCIGVSPCSGANRRAVDGRLLVSGFTPTIGNTQPAVLIGTIVPNSGDALNGLGLASQGYPRGGYESPSVLFAPRFGFAYQPTKNNDTVIRGGFGISYDRVQGNVIMTQITNPPTINTVRLLYGSLNDVAGGLNIASPPNVVGYARQGNVPSVYSFNFGIQRNIGFGTVIDVAYVGTLSRHLLQQRNLNAIPYLTTFQASAQDATRALLNPSDATRERDLPTAYTNVGFNFSGQYALPAELLRPFQGYGNINYREFVGTSNYHSLQSQVTRRFSRGLTFGIAYTFSKALGTSVDDFENTHPFNSRAYDYRLLNFDRTHTFVVNYVYDLPRVSRLFGGFGENRAVRAVTDNFQISGISQYYSGTPYELAVGIQGINAGQRILGTYDLQPLYRVRSEAQTANGTTQLDPTAFVAPAIGDTSPAPRNYLRLPGFFNHDVAVFKNFPFGSDGGRYLQLRFEFFNVFNSAQFNSVNTGTQLTNANGQTGAAIFNGYNPSSLSVSNNLRPTDLNNPRSQLRLGQFFGEVNNTRPGRVVQLAAKFYF